MTVHLQIINVWRDGWKLPWDQWVCKLCSLKQPKFSNTAICVCVQFQNRLTGRRCKFDSTMNNQRDSRGSNSDWRDHTMFPFPCHTYFSIWYCNLNQLFSVSNMHLRVSVGVNENFFTYMWECHLRMWSIVFQLLLLVVCGCFSGKPPCPDPAALVTGSPPCCQRLQPGPEMLSLWCNFRASWEPVENHMTCASELSLWLVRCAIAWHCDWRQRMRRGRRRS